MIGSQACTREAPVSQYDCIPNVTVMTGLATQQEEVEPSSLTFTIANIYKRCWIQLKHGFLSY